MPPWQLWELSPKEVENCFKGYKQHVEAWVKLQDQLNHALGRYISYGVNAPNKYPKKPFGTKTDKKPTTMTSDEEVMRYFNQFKKGKT